MWSQDATGFPVRENMPTGPSAFSTAMPMQPSYLRYAFQPASTRARRFGYFFLKAAEVLLSSTAFMIFSAMSASVQGAVGFDLDTLRGLRSIHLPQRREDDIQHVAGALLRRPLLHIGRGAQKVHHSLLSLRVLGDAVGAEEQAVLLDGV